MVNKQITKDRIIADGLANILEFIEEQIDEYSKNITGAEEAAFMDTLYEEYVSNMSYLKVGVESVLDILNS